MAAENEGGGGAGRKLGPLPLWAWALIAGASVGLVYFLRQSRTSPTTAAAATQAGDSNLQPTTILPVDAGLANEQFQQLLDAIKALQGDDSTPIGPPTTLPQPIHIPPGVTGADRDTGTITGPHSAPRASSTTAILHTP